MRDRRIDGIRIAMAGRKAGGRAARKDEARKEGRSVGGAGRSRSAEDIPRCQSGS